MHFTHEHHCVVDGSLELPGKELGAILQQTARVKGLAS